MNKKIRELNGRIEQEKKAAQEKIAKVKAHYSEREKRRMGEVCIGVTLEKENRKLKEKLEKSEQARSMYEKYQEKKVAGLQNELKKLRELSTRSSDSVG